ncbi:MAG TPA: amidohydrolase family protein [bacterium]|nr:amidohydrolase family protein [bacterium]
MRTLLKNAAVISMAGPDAAAARPADVLIEDGRISRVAPPGDGEGQTAAVDEPTLDLRGAYVMPGLIDAHCHITLSGGLVGTELAHDPRMRILRGADNARRTLLAGITTIRDTCGLDDGDVLLRDAIAAGKTPGPRIVACGRMITMTGGHGWFYGQEADGPDEVRRAVRERIKVRTDWVKFMASGGFAEEGEQPASTQLDADELTAGVREAAKAGRKTCAHAHGAPSIKNCLRAGIDSIEHASFMDQEAIDLLRQRDGFIVPTFSIYYKMKETGADHDLPAYVVELARRAWDLKVERFLAAHRAGVRVAAGSDNGSPAAPHPDIATELEIFVRIGLSSYQALRTATADAAKLLGLDGEIGAVEPGRRADLIVLKDNPLSDVSAVRRVAGVIHDGHIVRADDFPGVPTGAVPRSGAGATHVHPR